MVINMNTAIGKSVQRKDAWDKVTGRAEYTDDLSVPGLLTARILTSTYAHARILKIDTSEALGVNGVKSVMTGADCPVLFGPLLQDRPALARDIVRYAGEPVALVVAADKPTAEKAVRCIKVDYEPLPFVLTPSQALAGGGTSRTRIRRRIQQSSHRYLPRNRDKCCQPLPHVQGQYGGSMEALQNHCRAALFSAAFRSFGHGSANGQG